MESSFVELISSYAVNALLVGIVAFAVAAHWRDRQRLAARKEAERWRRITTGA